MPICIWIGIFFGEEENNMKRNNHYCVRDWMARFKRVNEQWMLIIWWNYSSISVPLMLWHGWPATTVQHHIHVQTLAASTNTHSLSIRTNSISLTKSICEQYTLTHSNHRKPSQVVDICFFVTSRHWRQTENNEVRQYVNYKRHGMARQSIPKRIITFGE